MRVAFLATIAAASIGCAPAPATLAPQADTISTADRAALVQELQESNRTFLASIAGLSEAQWRFKPAPTRWSIAEVAEHLVLVEQGLGGMIRSALVPITRFSSDSAAQLEAATRGLYGDRTRRFPAAEGFQPTGQWPTQAALVAVYNEARAANLAYTRTTRDPLRARGGPHPAFGTIDGVHWMLIPAVHMNRHVQQIEEVKRAEGYPSR